MSGNEDKRNLQMATQTSALLDKTLCKFFCEAIITDLNVIDNQDPQRSLSNLGHSSRRGCSKCLLLYETCAALYPSLLENASLILVQISSAFGCVEIGFDDYADSFVAPDEKVYLNYLYSTPQPDWLPLLPFRNPLCCRENQFQEVIRDWLNDCDKNHRVCRRSGIILPVRVINVGDDQGKEPHLHVTNGDEFGRYLALSHCWGDVQLIQTKTTNYSQHRITIPFYTLPKTFQHAIKVARAIDVQYIWIDSLCILQDDSSDWEKESSKMASIYQNAYAVILASNTTNSQSGLWNSAWDSYNTESVVKNFSYTNNDGSVSQIIARKALSHEDNIPESYLQYESPSPLSTRAWTLQEELLAWRCIYFTGKELLWKCEHGKKCECMQEDTNIEVNDKTIWESVKSEDPTRRFGGWRSLMAHYSKRNITYESDRLPAISGIVQHFRAKGAGEYLAGMWREDILESLMWLPYPVSHGVKDDNLISTYRRRASPYRAPTWSWISLETYGVKDKKSRCPGIVDWQESSYWYLKALKATVLKACCEPLGMDPTGAVKSGFILLKSKCVEAWVTWEGRTSPILCGNVSLNVHWDIDLELGVKQRVSCLLIGEAATGENGMEPRPFRALVLRSSKVVVGAFERIGLFNGDKFQKANHDLFANIKDSTTMIV